MSARRSSTASAPLVALSDAQLDALAQRIADLLGPRLADRPASRRQRIEVTPVDDDRTLERLGLRRRGGSR